MAIKTAKELASACKKVATDYKTLYVLGCFGAPLHEANKARYLAHQSYNRKVNRKPKIEAATADTFGFDCVCLIKALLWGWDGDTGAVYGGASYASNNVPDYGADKTISCCSDVSTDFSEIQVGEVVWFPGHIGVYIGDGLAVECTPKWKDGVQITAVHNIGRKNGYNGRTWTKHGKLPYVTYEAVNAPMGYSLVKFIRDVQDAFGATVDGVAGPETLSKTLTLSAVLNRKHEAVRAVQQRLNVLGYTQVGVADGVAGAKFTAAVKAFQRDNGCVADGEITARNKTWKKLLGME